jgi:hypothetical protein
MAWSILRSQMEETAPDLEHSCGIIYKYEMAQGRIELADKYTFLL